MSDQRISNDDLLDALQRQGLGVAPERFEAFARAHRQLLVFIEQLRERSQRSVKQLGADDEC